MKFLLIWCFYRWYAYEHVWRRDKSATVARFCRSGPAVKDYDDKLRFYTNLASELSQAPHHNTHGCVRYANLIYSTCILFCLLLD